MDWFRSHHGAPTDPKWLVIGRRANVPPGIVAAIAWALMDYASQNADRGSVAGFDVETTATFFGWSEEQVKSVLDAMLDKKIIVDERLASWDKRQPKREDSSTERVRRHRERDETQCNAAERAVTPDRERERVDKKERVSEEERSSSADPRRVIFGDIANWLAGERGCSVESAKAWLGKAAKAHGDGNLIDACSRIRAGPYRNDVISALTAELKRFANGKTTRASPITNLYAGSAIALAKRAERSADRREGDDPAEPLLDSG